MRSPSNNKSSHLNYDLDVNNKMPNIFFSSLLLMIQHSTFRKHGIEEFRDELDQLTEKVLYQGKFLLPCKKRQNQPVQMIERNWGKFPFWDVNCTPIPTMVMACMRACKREARDEIKAGKANHIHPLILRTYEYPPQPKDKEFSVMLILLLKVHLRYHLQKR